MNLSLISCKNLWVRIDYDDKFLTPGIKLQTSRTFSTPLTEFWKMIGLFPTLQSMHQLTADFKPALTGRPDWNHMLQGVRWNWTLQCKRGLNAPKEKRNQSKPFYCP